jgi:hypothetical protein
MVYIDKIHLVSDSINELHEFAKLIGLKKCYYHGFKKGIHIMILQIIKF